MKRILLCCAAGMSSSILVKKMRLAAKEHEIDVVIAAVSGNQVPLYVSKVDVILVAPALVYEFERIKKIAAPYKVRVFLIGREDYGQMNGEIILLKLLNKIEQMKQEEIKMGSFTSIIESKLMPIAVKLGSNRFLTIIRNSMVASMALLIIGSIATLFLMNQLLIS